MGIKKIHIYFDGACWNKKNEPAPMGVGVAVYIDDEYSEQYSSAKMVKSLGTSPTSEWIGCLRATLILGNILMQNGYIDPQSIEIKVFSDNRNVVDTFKGINTPKMPDHIQCFQGCIQNLKIVEIRVQDFDITWIPREQNSKADELSKISRTASREHFGHS